MDGFDRDWTEEKEDTKLPILEPYIESPDRTTENLDAYITSLDKSTAALSTWEEPIDTNVLNIGDVLTTAGGGLLENIVTALTKTFELFFPPKPEEPTSTEGIETTIDVPGLVTGMQSSLSPLTLSLDNLVTEIALQNKQGFGGEGFDLAGELSGGTMTLSDVNFTTPDVSTKLDMNVSVNTQLYIDGYLMWQAIKDYARVDLVSYGGVAGTAGANYTFA